MAQGPINQNEKTLVFCATQDHALAVRGLVNQMKTNRDPNYCQRVTANDGELGEQHLRDFQDNERTIPTIYDFVKAHHHFSDPEWDGEPIDRARWSFREAPTRVQRCS